MKLNMDMEFDQEQTHEDETPKRGRGRPKGSKSSKKRLILAPPALRSRSEPVALVLDSPALPSTSRSPPDTYQNGSQSLINQTTIPETDPGLVTAPINGSKSNQRRTEATGNGSGRNFLCEICLDGFQQFGQLVQHLNHHATANGSQIIRYRAVGVLEAMRMALASIGVPVVIEGVAVAASTSVMQNGGHSGSKMHMEGPAEPAAPRFAQPQTDDGCIMVVGGALPEPMGKGLIPVVSVRRLLIEDLEEGSQQAFTTPKRKRGRPRKQHTATATAANNLEILDSSGDSGDKTELANPIRKPKPYKCQICRKKFAHEARMLYHVRFVHHQALPSRGRRAKSSTSSAAGGRQTTGEANSTYAKAKPWKFACSTCGKGFLTKLGLEGHERMHTRTQTGAGEHSCKFCTSKFWTSDGLKIHMQAAHRPRGAARISGS